VKAALLEAPHSIVITEISPPKITAPDQVLIRVKAVGICGSEVHAFEGTHPYRKAPVILGHEMAGVVAATGEEVGGFKEGDRVVVDPQWTCGQCVYCRRGDINLCPEKRVLGTSTWPGTFGEYVVVPAEATFHLPESLSFTQGSLIEPLTVAVHVARQADLKAGESVAILGSGSIGGLLSGVSRVSGANPIIAADIRQHCMDAARERLGATHDFLLPDERLVPNIRELTGGEGVNVAFVCADDVSLVSRALEMVKRRGRIVLVALLTYAPMQLTAYEFIRKEVQLIGSIMSNHEDLHRAIELVESGRVDVEAIATHLLPIEEVQRGMELASSKRDEAIKVMLSF
jgi:L-iditol 2-dehydrogenase